MIKVRFKNPNITMKSIFSKILRSIIAIILCFVLFAIYSVIGGLMGWRHGGGYIPMMIFFALMSSLLVLPCLLMLVTKKSDLDAENNTAVVDS